MCLILSQKGSSKSNPRSATVECPCVRCTFYVHDWVRLQEVRAHEGGAGGGGEHRSEGGPGVAESGACSDSDSVQVTLPYSSNPPEMVVTGRRALRVG